MAAPSYAEIEAFIAGWHINRSATNPLRMSPFQMGRPIGAPPWWEERSSPVWARVASHVSGEMPAKKKKNKKTTSRDDVSLPDDDSSSVATPSPSFEPSPSPFVARDWNAGVEHYHKNERRQYGDHNPDCNRAHEEKGRVTGTITFWKSPKHFGFAEYADRDITVFVHADRFRRHLRDSVRTSGLQCGDEITFKVGPPGEGHSCMIALDVDLPRDQSGGGRQRSRTPPRPRARPPYADARDVGDLPAELREASWAMAMWLRYVAMFPQGKHRATARCP